MNSAELLSALETRLAAAVTNSTTYPVLNATPVAYENNPNRSDESWIRAQLVEFEPVNGVIGAQVDPDPYIKREGNFVLSIFTQLNIGTKALNDIVSELTTLFQNKTFSGVWTRIPALRKIGDDQHGYYHASLSIPFTTVT